MSIWLLNLVDKYKKRGFTGKLILSFCKGELSTKIEKREVEKVENN